MLGAAAVMAGGSIASSIISGNKAQKAAAAAQAQAQAQFLMMLGRMDEAAALLESVGVPSVEAQRVVLEGPDSVPGIISEFTGIHPDPKLVEAQMQSMGTLDEISKTGRTGEEAFEDLLTSRQLSGERQSAYKNIQQNLAQRGMSSSGLELAGKLGANQNAAIARELGSAQRQGKAKDRALQAIIQKGQLAGSIRGQNYGEAAGRASALDAAGMFNAQNKWNQNVAQSGVRNQQEMYNKALLQQQFQNELAKNQAIANAKMGAAGVYGQMAQNTSQAGQNKAQGILDQGAAISNTLGSLGGSMLGTYGTVNEGNKNSMFYDKSADGSIFTKKEYNNGGAVGDYDWMDDDIREAVMLNRRNQQQFAGGGVPVPDNDPSNEDRYLAGDVIPGDSFEGDRVDAKVNSGEMVLNLPQQQRLMELLKGYRSLADLGGEDIVSSQDGQPPETPVPGGVPGGSDELGLPPEALQGLGEIPPGAEGLPSLGDGQMPPMPTQPPGMPPMGPPPARNGRIYNGYQQGGVPMSEFEKSKARWMEAGRKSREDEERQREEEEERKREQMKMDARIRAFFGGGYQGGMGQNNMRKKANGGFFQHGGVAQDMEADRKSREDEERQRQEEEERKREKMKMDARIRAFFGTRYKGRMGQNNMKENANGGLFQHGGVAQDYDEGFEDYEMDDYLISDSIGKFNESNKDNTPEWKRGLTAKYSRLSKQEEEDKEKKKHRNAHMKALEVLTGKKRNKEIPPLD